MRHSLTSLFSRFFATLILSALLFACNNSGSSNQSSGEKDLAGTSEIYDDTASVSFKEALEYREKIQAALTAPVPVLKLTDSCTADQILAQELCFADNNFLKYTRDSVSKSAYRNEVFNVYKAGESDLSKQTSSACADGGCYKVELYNFALNITTIGLVNIKSKQVIQVLHLPQTQPEIPSHLKQLAITIAAENEHVQKALGFKPGEKDAVMSATKTALNKSRCERSMHLCVAPTFVKNNKALWTIVDLTDLRVAGIRWTNVGVGGPSVTERKLQNEKITECFCKTETVLKRNGWKLGYMLTSSDGMRVSDVSYNGVPVLSSAKLVDWHVSYSNSDGFGYSDAIGCPYFSTAAVVAIESPRISDLIEDGKKAGFVIEQNFYSEGWPNACNYNYQQRFEFYNDGSFRIACASIGRGCGNDGTYRPVLRIAFAGQNNSFSQWDGTNWKPWNQEQWHLQQANTAYTKEGYLFKIDQAGGQSWFVEPARGQFKDGGRGDHAFSFVTINKPGRDEGESDLVTIGPCCNTDYKQGPEKFIEPNPEPLANEALVLWYVPQMKNDDTKGYEYCWAESYVKDGIISTRKFPCFAGPMFIPAKK